MLVGRLGPARSFLMATLVVALFSAAPSAVSATGVVTNVEWAKVANLPAKHIDATSAIVAGKWYVFGAYKGVNPVRYSWSVHVLNTATGVWTTARRTPAQFSHAGSAVVDDRYVYIAGGFRPDPSLVCNVDPVCESYGSTEVWKYDTVTNKYTSAPALPEARGSGSLALVGRTLHFVGGLDLNRAERLEHWTLDVDTGASWVPDVPLPAGAGRNHFALVAQGSTLYVVGGQTGLAVDFNTVLLKSVMAFDTSNPEAGWFARADMPQPLSHTAQSTVCYLGVLLTGSGDNPQNRGTAKLWEYDPVSDAWTTVASGIPGGRFGAVMQTDGTKLYVTGGSPGALGLTTYIGTVS
jgi:N-acetylneuraminic acid mutarotase